MGLMFRRRRPVARLAAGAVTAGVAYHAGQRRAEQDVYNAQAEEAHQATYQPTYQPTQYSPPPSPAGAGGPGGLGDLDRLVELHRSGALSDEEFTAAKAKLLGIRAGG